MLVDMGGITSMTATAAGVVTISNASESVADFFVGNGVCGVELRHPDGTMYTFYDDSGASAPNFTQKNATTDWIIPNSAATDATYHAKLTKTGGTATLDGGGAAEATWTAVSGGILWQIVSSSSTSYTGTMAISNDGGSTTLDTCTITLTITAL
jgi:hypothetical protein